MNNLEQKQIGFWQIVRKFFGDSIIQIIIAIIITVSFYYGVERREIDPRYAIGDVELIAGQTLDAPDLKLYWKDEEIEDIKSVNISIWNNGKQYLSAGNISTTNPIRILIPIGVQVLYAEFIETSRPSLRFDVTFYPSDDNRQALQVDIIGDEVLEHNDGGTIKILFTGIPQGDFSVTGRIFGSPSGFRKTNLDASTWQSIKLAWLSVTIIASLFLVFFLLSTRRAFVRNRSWSGLLLLLLGHYNILLSNEDKVREINLVRKIFSILLLIAVFMWLIFIFLSSSNPSWVVVNPSWMISN